MSCLAVIPEVQLAVAMLANAAHVVAASDGAKIAGYETMSADIERLKGPAFRLNERLMLRRGVIS